MAHHLSAKKRIRQNAVRRLRNRFKMVGMRNAIKEFRELTDKNEAEKRLPEISGMIDRVAKHNIIHKKKASNLKSKLAKHIHTLG